MHSRHHPSLLECTQPLRRPSPITEVFTSLATCGTVQSYQLDGDDELHQPCVYEHMRAALSFRLTSRRCPLRWPRRRYGNTFVRSVRADALVATTIRTAHSLQVQLLFATSISAVSGRLVDPSRRLVPPSSGQWSKFDASNNSMRLLLNNTSHIYEHGRIRETPLRDAACVFYL